MRSADSSHEKRGQKGTTVLSMSAKVVADAHSSLTVVRKWTRQVPLE
jgi:hypothetical protein